MDITNLINIEQFMAGIPTEIPNLDNPNSPILCKVYPATLRQIAEAGVKNFYSYLNIFTLNKEDVDEYFKEQNIEMDITPFQFLLSISKADSQYYNMAKKAFQFFLHEDITILETNEAIVLGDISENRIIDEKCFEVIKTVVEKQHVLDTESSSAKMDNPSDAKAAQIIKKLKEGRKMREKAKGNSDLTFSDLVASLAAKGNGLNILNVWDLTYYAFNDQFKRMQMIESYQSSHQSLLAGADPKKVKLEYWIDTIRDKEK